MAANPKRKRNAPVTTGKPAAVVVPAAGEPLLVAAPPFEYRHYQRDARNAFEAGKRRLFLAWHRRAGKDAFCLQLASEEMPKRRGNYWHLFPLHAHARRAIWDGIDPVTGMRFIDRYFPVADREYTNATDMLIRMKCGSSWQLLGSDHYDRLVGAGTVGITWSEMALSDPRFYEYARPIIRENNGWIAIASTFRGRNHAWQMFQQLRGNADWYTDLRTVRDTRRNDGTPVISEADVEKDRAEGMTEALIQQEYYCNPAASLPGSLYGASVQEIAEHGRAGIYAYESRFPVYASWSLEFAPVNISVAFMQPAENEVRCIGSRSFMFTTLAEAVATARAEFPWGRKVAAHIVPPDDDSVYQDLFDDMQLFAEAAPQLGVSKLALTTQAFLSRLHVDNVARTFERVSSVNNELLMDSLNGYRLRESSDSEEFTLNQFISFERYLARAVENYAAWDRQVGASVAWAERDYSAHDLGVI